MSKKIGLYIRLDEEVVKWLRSKLPAKKGSLSNYIEELIRREIRLESGEYKDFLNEVDKLIDVKIDSSELPKIRKELEDYMLKEI